MVNYLEMIHGVLFVFVAIKLIFIIWRPDKLLLIESKCAFLHMVQPAPLFKFPLFSHRLYSVQKLLRLAAESIGPQVLLQIQNFSIFKE